MKKAGERAVAMLEAEQQKTQAELDRQADMWTDKRKDQYRAERQAQIKGMVQAEVKKARDQYGPKIESMIASVDRRLDAYFAELPRLQFVQMIAAYKQTGIRLDDSELAGLLASCENYREAVLVDRFAQARTKPAPDSYTPSEVMDAVDGKTVLTAQNRVLSDPCYLNVKPEAEIRRAWREYADSARKVVSDFCGERGQLTPFIDGTVPQDLRVETGLSFFQPGWSDDLLKLVDSDINGILKDRDRVLTADEKAYIDLIMGTRSPKECRQLAVQLAQADEVMQELLEADPRYSQAVKEALSAEDGE